MYIELCIHVVLKFKITHSTLITNAGGGLQGPQIIFWLLH